MQHNSVIFETLFNRPFTGEDNARFLKELTDSHPYFSPAQFFLLHSTPENTEAFEMQAVKTNLLFNNPHWLNFQLRQTKSVDIIEQGSNLPEINNPEEETTTIDDLPDNTDSADTNTGQTHDDEKHFYNRQDI